MFWFPGTAGKCFDLYSLVSPVGFHNTTEEWPTALRHLMSGPTSAVHTTSLVLTISLALLSSWWSTLGEYSGLNTWGLSCLIICAFSENQIIHTTWNRPDNIKPVRNKVCPPDSLSYEIKVPGKKIILKIKYFTIESVAFQPCLLLKDWFQSHIHFCLVYFLIYACNYLWNNAQKFHSILESS